jgi:hypothetical protein
MTKNQLKAGIIVVMLAALLGSAVRTRAYPAYLRQAAKFGAKDCLFCHTTQEGGEGWNERGQWLIDEKERRKADAIDVGWLKDYKEKETEKAKEKDPAKEPAKAKP